MLMLDSGPALSGPEKAAIVMLALGEKRAAQLFALLDKHEVLEISRTMSSLGHVDARMVELLLTEFRQRMTNRGGVVGGVAATQKLLQSLGTEQAGTILDEIRGAMTPTVWEELARVDDAVLASYLTNEHPQTVALILSRLEAEQAARLLAHLPEELATDVVLRLLRMDTVQEDLVADLERVLQAELAGTLSRGAGRDQHEVMAGIFNRLDRSTETRLMQSLESMNKEAAERVRAFMFTFEDLARLDGAGIQLLVRAAGNERLSRALKGAGEPLRDLFFANMSERAAKMLREDMQGMGPVKLKDVEEAQQFLVGTAKDLIASGQITLQGGQEDEMVY
jgi:flagellar motor switch protein FliG